MANENLNNTNPEIPQNSTNNDVQEAPVKTQDRHTAEDPYIVTEQENIDPDNEKRRGRIPAALASLFKEYDDKVAELINNGTIDKNDQKMADEFVKHIITAPLAQKNDFYASNINNNSDSFVNNIEYGDKQLNTRLINTNKDKGSNVSEATKILSIVRALSLGAPVQVPLWHSGFWITLRPPIQSEIIQLQLAIADSQVTLGRDTNTLIFSNYSAIFNRLLTNFIVNHIADTTLNITKGNITEITKYINIQDFNIMVMGILDCLYPDGINVIRTCKNVLVVDDNGKPKCNFSARALLDPKKLIWVDRNALGEKLLTHMSKKSPNSMSIESVKEYQKSISNMLDKSYDVKTENDNIISIKFGLPTLANYLDASDKWVSDIITKAEKLFTEDDTVERKDDKISNLASSVMLSSYNIFVKSISIGEDEVTKQSSVSELLSTLTMDGDVYDGFINNIKDFISNTAIAIVATPNYECPKCKADQTQGKTGPFKEFIPLNVGEYFFHQCGLRTLAIQSRMLN